MKCAVFLRMTRSVHGQGSEIQLVFQRFTWHQESAHSLAEDLMSLNLHSNPTRERMLTFSFLKGENGACEFKEFVQVMGVLAAVV